MDCKVKHLKKTFCFLVSMLLCACHTIHPVHQTSIQQSISTVQQGANIDKSLDDNRYSYYKKHRSTARFTNDLMPPLSSYVNDSRNEQPRFDVTANKIPAKEFFMGLAAGQYNIVVNPNVDGMISLNLKNVTISEVMDAVRDTYGYDYHRTSYGYEVLQPQLETQIFHINYLDVQRSGRSYMQLTTGQVSNKVGTVTVGGTSIYSGGSQPGSQGGNSGPPEGLGTISSVETKTEMQFWKTMENAIQGMIGTSGGRSVTVNAQAGVISVRAYPGELHRVASYINSLQSSLNRQVILEAKILEVNLDDQYQAGIDWALLANPAANQLNGTGNTDAGIGQAANSTFDGTDLTQLSGIFALKINGNFKVLINLLQTQGNVQVLSSPHISTVNNQKAVIKVGQDEFFVTGVSTTNTIVGTNTLPSQDVSLTPFFSGITLDVTPEISSDGNVVLHIHPSVSVVTQQTKTVGLGASTSGAPNNLTLPLAFSTIRESDNIVRAKNGQVVVIGGLMTNNMREIIAATPWISKVPFLGSMFRRTAQVSQKSELVILIRPIVTNNRVLATSLESEKRNFQILKRPFHTGGLPKIFGNEAEEADRN